MFLTDSSGPVLLAQVSTPTTNISTAVILLVAVVVLWLVLKVFIRIVLLGISLGISGLAGTIFHEPVVPHVENLYTHLDMEGGLPFLSTPPDSRLVAFAVVFLVTFLLTAFLLASIFRKAS